MPDSLFLYCPVNNDERKSWLEKLLVENQIYFRSREQLNDPNELRPKIIFDGTDKQIRDYVRRLLLSYAKNRLPPAKRLIEENKFIYRLRNTTPSFEVVLHDILDRVGLLCLSESSSINLLWAHYADGHRGVCIEFDANIGLFLAAQQVHYTNQIPTINRLVDDNDAIIRKSMFTKNPDWEYEREWRVVARWEDAERIEQYLMQHNVPAPLQSFIRSQHGSGYYSFPPEAIRCVIRGSRADPSLDEWLREIVGNTRTKIAIKTEQT